MGTTVSLHPTRSAREFRRRQLLPEREPYGRSPAHPAQRPVGRGRDQLEKIGAVVSAHLSALE